MLSLIRNIYFPIAVLSTTIICFPVLLIRPFSPSNNYIFQKVFNILAVPFMGFTHSIQNKEFILENVPSVIIGNHQHNFDMLMFSKVFPKNILLIGKKEIATIPFFGQAFWLAGNILINRKNNQKAIKSMGEVERQIINKNASVMIFPEGHRNSNKKLLPFKKGAFYTAINAQLPIICYSVSSYARNMNLNRIQSGHMHVKVHPPIETKGLSKEDIPNLIESTRKLIQQGIQELDKELGHQ